MSANLSPNLDMNFAGTAAEPFSIALIGPDAEKRTAVAGALAQWPGADVRQFPSYPPALDDVAELVKLSFDVIVIDAESDSDYAIQIIENLCTRSTATVMAYAWSAKQDLAERFKRSGAREYLDAPFEFSVPSALERAADARYAKISPAKSWEAKLLVFFGAKGGSGTTTVACSYAIALAQESRQRTLLIDLGLPLGDAALNLGLTSDYSTEDALKDPERLDPSLLEALAVKHESGIEVLAAPSKVPEVTPSAAAIDKLMKMARKVYTNVIVDVGSRVDLMDTTLFAEAYRIYLVSQASISDLRNAERLMSRYFSTDSQRLEIVINRFEPGAARMTEEQMNSALGRPVRWRVPSDNDAIHNLQSAHAPMSDTDSQFSRSILEMAGSITLHPVRPGKSAPTASSNTWQGISATQSDSGAERPTVDTEKTNEGSGPDGLPNIIWQSPETISYGTPLSDAQLNATAAVPGNFVYTPGHGYVLPVGTHTLWVTFTPASGAVVQSAVSISIAKATPTIMWPVPRPITCDTPLSEVQLNATASVSGKFEYAPELGKVLTAGEHALGVVFTPNDDKSYSSTKATVSITVEKLKPEIEWPTPEKMKCGTKLGSKQLNAKASVAGTFVYSPEAGEVLEPGEHVLTAHFTPADGSRYSMAQSNITVTVMKAPPRITWATPEPIVYGAPLGPGQLNATASEEGTFDYNPGVGAVLAVGEHTPLVTFRPRDNEDYPTVQTAVLLTVVMAKPTISWNPPPAISAGTPLSVDELNATASVPGTFRYKPALGEILPVGKHTLSATFTPTDTMNYEPVKATVPLTVAELAEVEINWPSPSSISYGTPLSEAQLNATASVAGTFAYGPDEGNVLPPGKHTLLLVFTPDDPQTYAVANATVALKVDALQDVSSLLTAHTQGPIGHEVMDQSIPEINERDIVRKASAPDKEQELVVERVVVKEPVAAAASTPKPDKPRETRTYKGVIYEKGDDGQWHRL
jgi:MinD-like ATPase involved in chromosome partitioning or flagellar assembly